MWKTTIALNFCFILIFCNIQSGYSRNRQHYGGKVLNIAPKECTSSKYPGIVGTCMISLECQQRNGTVIGACRDGVLFGACCIDAEKMLTVVTESSAPPPPPLIDGHNAPPFKIPQDFLNLAVFNFASDSPENHENELVTNSPELTVSTASLEESKSSSIPSTTTTEQFNIDFSHKNSLLSNSTTTSSSLSTSSSLPLNENVTSNLVSIPDYYTFPSPPTTTFLPTLGSMKTDETSKSASVESTESITNLENSSPLPTTKFQYGKIKYTPRPVKLRSTTEKVLWTRRPTTETSYSVFTSKDEDEEEEDEDQEYQQVSKLHVTEPPSNPNSASIEASTVPYFSSQSQNSTEELQSVPIISSEPKSPKPLAETPTTTMIIQENVTESISTKRSRKPLIPLKNSRLSNEIQADEDAEERNSDGWDNKLNEFVDQVVEGIAGELDKSNIDDVVFKPTYKPLPKKTTTTKEPKVIMKKRNKSKSKISKDESNKKKRKDKPLPTTKTPKKKRKPVKKVTTTSATTTSGESVETEHDVLDYREVCGVRPLVRRKSRIVGGNPSIHGNWPWHALVKETVWWGIFSKVKCGGVLIGPRHVLTAAHCQPQQTGKLSVVLGVTDSDNPSSYAVTKTVRRVIRHPEFNPRSYENDIAILELDSPVSFQPHIVPICLPDMKENFVGKKGFVTGMGLLKHDGERPSMLYEVDVPILNNTDCQQQYRRSGNSKPIKPSFICAGYKNGRKDSCGGDSGGPLSVKRSNGQWVLAGTVSHGIKCAVPNQPGIYMRTTWYRPFIDKVMRTARLGVPKSTCHGPPSICDNHQARSGGIMDTIFRIFRLARRLWKDRK